MPDHVQIPLFERLRALARRPLTWGIAAFAALVLLAALVLPPATLDRLLGLVERFAPADVAPVASER